MGCTVPPPPHCQCARGAKGSGASLCADGGGGHVRVYPRPNFTRVHSNGFTKRMMGLTLTGSYISLFVAVQLVHLLQEVGGTGKCETVFKGFSDCLLRLGDNMASYPQDLDERENLQTICSYWDDFHACATTALADCQGGATELWEKLKKESRNLEFQGSLFELCGGGNGASPGTGPPGLGVFLPVLLALLTWLAF